MIARTGNARVQWRTLGSGEAGLAYGLHLSATKSMQPGLVRLDDPDHFVRHAGEEGVIVGGFVKNEGLVAYGVMGVSSRTVDHMAQILRVDDKDRSRFGILDGAAVSPAWRGRGLHRKLIRARLRLASARNYSLIGSTVAPANVASLCGLLEENFRVCAFSELYGGQARLILEYDTLATKPQWALHRKVLSTDITGHQLALDAGLAGFTCSRGNGGAMLIHYGVEMAVVDGGEKGTACLSLSDSL